MKNDNKLLVGLIILSVFTLVFGFFRLRESIIGPFRLPKIETSQITDEELHQILAQKDTDLDGLSDEDEIFRYHTSVFLDDSDSDGYNDKEEVEASSDPLNPESTPFRKVAENKNLEGNNAEQKKALTEGMSPAEIREFLIKAGISRETVEKVDDETLKNLYNETVKETGINPKEFSANELEEIDWSQIIKNNSSGENSSQNAQTLSAEQIRQLLILAGMNSEILKTVDDETLKKVFFEALLKAQMQSQ